MLNSTARSSPSRAPNAPTKGKMHVWHEVLAQRSIISSQVMTSWFKPRWCSNPCPPISKPHTSQVRTVGFGKKKKGWISKREAGEPGTCDGAGDQVSRICSVPRTVSLAEGKLCGNKRSDHVPFERAVPAQTNPTSPSNASLQLVPEKAFRTVRHMQSPSSPPSFFASTCSRGIILHL